MVLEKVTVWLESTFGEDKIKWIKGIIAYFLIVCISNFVSPFTAFINELGWKEIWVTYVLIVLNAGVMVAIGFIVFFLGKPIMPSTLPDIEPPEVVVIEEEPTEETTVDETTVDETTIDSLPDDPDGTI